MIRRVAAMGAAAMAGAAAGSAEAAGSAAARWAAVGWEPPGLAAAAGKPGRRYPQPVQA